MSHYSQIHKEETKSKSSVGADLSAQRAPILRGEARAESGKTERYANGHEIKFRCRHRDCRYGSAGKDCVNGKCDYIGITGHSRILWHRLRGLSEDPAECQLYEKRRKEKKNDGRKATEKNPVGRKDEGEGMPI